MGTISRRGVVKSTDKTTVVVEIVQSPACGACALADRCGLGECTGRHITITQKSEEDFVPGEEVLIELDESDAFKAVFLSYIFPLILIIFTLACTMILTGDEIKSGIVGIFVLIPYYFLLLLTTKRKNFSVRFKLRKITAQKNG